MASKNQTSKRIGKRPYEMGDRPGVVNPLVDFEDLDGWTLEFQQGAKAQLTRTREQQMDGQYVAKLIYSGTSTNSTVTIRPPEPIPIPGAFTEVNLWVYGNNWGWAPDRSTPQVQIILLIETDGQEQEIDVGRVGWMEWHMMHRRVGEITAPTKFCGISVRGCANRARRVLYFDSLKFYWEKQRPLDIPKRPQKLPFPTTPDTILPTMKEACENSVALEGISYLFEARTSKETIRYVYTPISGTLEDIEVEIDEEEPFLPAEGGGPVVWTDGQERGPEDEEIERRLISHEIQGDKVVSRWRWNLGEESVEFTIQLWIKGKSLIVDLEGGTGRVSQLVLGHFSDLSEFKLIKVPFMTFGGDDPLIMYTKGKFISVLLDWYNTEASRFFSYSEERCRETGACNGGAVYLPRTDGRRNELKERLFLTLSSDFHEVLPNIPNPESPMGEIIQSRLWRQHWGMSSDATAYDTFYERLATYKKYGVDHLIVRHHEETWRDDGESFTMRLTAAPKKGGDEALRDYVERVKRLGYICGLYTNYIDLSPVNANWDEDRVALTPEGDWVRAWMRCYALKPSLAPQMEAYYAPRINEKFGTQSSYCDVHTCVAPWARLDCDDRVPGAATFRSTFRAYGELLLNERIVHKGPCFSEGGFHWFYAGLVDGNYGQIAGPDPDKRPVLVDFDLLKIHPLETDVGVGGPFMFYKKVPDREKNARSGYFDRFLATTIAYGHIGYLMDDEWGLPAVLKSYYMIQKLQTYYALAEAVEIKYHRDGQLMDSSEAIASDAYLDGQIYVKYDTGLEVYVNVGRRKKWEVEVQDQKFTLSPSSFVAHGPDGFLAYSTDTPRGRIDYVDCEDYFYLDTRGRLMEFGGVVTDGAIVIQRGEWQLTTIPIDCSEEVEVIISYFWGERRRIPRLRVVGYTEEDESPVEVRAEVIEDRVIFNRISGVCRYDITLPEWMVQPKESTPPG